MHAKASRWNKNIQPQSVFDHDHRQKEKWISVPRPSVSGTHRVQIRLMHIVDMLAVAGMEYGVIKQVNRLDSDVFSPSICCLRTQNAATRPLLNSMVPVFEMHKHPGLDLQLVFRLASLLRKEGIEIIHSHNWSTFLHAVIAAKIARTPVLIHGEHGHEHQDVPIRRLFTCRLLAKRVDHVVAVSSDLARELMKSWRMHKARVSWIANGVDLDRFGIDACPDSLRNELGLGTGNHVVLNIGRLRPVKDPQTLLRAFATVHDHLPETRLLFVGSDRGTGMQEELERLAQDLGIRDSVFFVGERHDIPAFLNLSNVYVNSSIYEGMSNTILEAMAASRPVIATSVGGNPELVKHGETGYLVSPRDDRALASRILEILTDPQTGRSMGAAGRRAAERNYRMSDMIGKYAELYRDSLMRYKIKRTCPAAELLKRAIAQTLRLTGANHVKWLSKAHHLTIIGYHRILPLQDALQCPFPSMVTPKDLFVAQIAYMAENYHLMSISNAIRLLNVGKLPRRAIAVTFDDGYRDNYEHAFPILRRFHVPASFFVVTDAVDGKMNLWWDEVAEQVEEMLRCRLLLVSPEARNLPQWLLSAMQKAKSPEHAPHIAQQLVTWMNQIPRAERKNVLDLLRSIVGVREAPSKRLMLSWEEVKELHDSGQIIGSHTTSHEFLDEADEEQAWGEIHKSVTTLERKLNMRVRFFTYPAGRYGKNTSILLRRAGIEAAVTSRAGSNSSRIDVYQLRRHDAGYWCLRSGFSSAVFDMELHGWLNPFRVSGNQRYS
jgi:sugar transferase (PEP-CTERM/EpsH1 system associated)